MTFTESIPDRLPGEIDFNRVDNLSDMPEDLDFTPDGFEMEDDDDVFASVISDELLDSSYNRNSFKQRNPRQ